ncbi:type III restriction enzyme, res subunit [Bifidobacterium reuteri DSM 23975]|uniref:Type III restriction enzyme, res subunit n=1 Tax=Bifidobacterium reuteri DSM 23975 TaxID=1437610 RepID=A0A087CF44_9BIFI|nr:DEAD/DEAH box helicase family protein [Bifidobacterium reuteri]KFI81894.1 type III restriction enzyme, res subunit [Bifidobacterium reuteri DSM 23975]
MGILDISGKVRSAAPALPQIYAYTTPDVRTHDGWIKIGYTEQNVDERIRQQTHTANVRAHKEWNGNAIYEGTDETFHDTDFHAYLSKLGIERMAPVEPGGKPPEWFHTDGPTSRNYFYEFRENHGVADTPAAVPYTLRNEQQEAVDEAADYARIHPGGEFLWNAKPRFGKTLSTYALCKALDAVKVLIVTNRPAIANSWYSDYVKFLGTESGYTFVSETSELADKPYVMSRSAYQKALLAGNSPKCIEFVSLQDIKGSIYFGGAYKKLEEVAHLEWDLLVIDEAHEGVDTYKTDVAFDHINRRFTLHLSGTPFKALADEKFDEDAIYNWTYADEQKAKRDWSDPEITNPYETLPKLNLFTYQMSDIIADKASQGIELDGETAEYAFDLNEFFATDDRGYFKHNDDVDKFLDALTRQTKYPFSTPELRDELRHTLWMLNRVDSAKALARKLKKHPVFNDYEIVVAAGDGSLDDQKETEKSFVRVTNAIREHDRTITLSVGQLTTGVTIPEWTAVLMLSNMKSPALYMQAAFRAQNPCLFHEANTGRYLRKENAYVFDFDPARTLTIFEEFANNLNPSTAGGKGTLDEHKQNVRELLNFLPVLGEDEAGEMIELDAEKVLSLPRKIRSREVVKRGFMSDYLFQNISNVFRAPADIVTILQTLTPTPKPTQDLGGMQATADEAHLNEKGDVDIPEEQIIGTAAAMFGDKVYSEVENTIADLIEDAAANQKTPSKEDAELDALASQLSSNITKPIIDVAQQHYDDTLKPSQKTKIERKVKADADIEINRHIGDFKIQRNIIEQERNEKLEEAETAQEADRINAEYDQKHAEARDVLDEKLKDVAGNVAKQTGQTIVREVETAKSEAKRINLMDDIKDHLRGFSRTIPSFLMAYGDEDTTLESFDTIIPPNVFLEVTSITVDQFRLLRDGGDVNGTHFDGNLFDPVVFNDSVAEFIALKSKLANYFDESQTEDIFDYIPPQKTNQIFTPKKVVKQMVDLFEQENPGCFDDPEHTFADLYMKSGLFITEIVKRLYNSEHMRQLYPNGDERLKHIFGHQVYGIAPTEIIYQIATHYILGPNDEFGKDCETHFAMADSAQLSKEGKLADYVDKTFG